MNSVFMVGLMVVGLILSVTQVAAEEAADGEVTAAKEQIRYIELRPTFVTNFGFTADGRLKYLKADVSARVTSMDGASAINYHLPAIRDALVHLFSRQNESNVATGEGRETLRLEAVAELRALLEAEEGDGYIEDILFTNFILQR